MAVGDLTTVNVDPGPLSTSFATLYTIPASRKAVHIELHLTNTDSSSEYLPVVAFVPSAGSGSANNLMVNGVAGTTGLRKGESRQYTWDQFLGAGYTIQAKADVANKITHKLSVVIEEV